MTGANKNQEVAYPRDPNDWYVESRASVEQLADAVDFSTDGVPDLIWDPCCGGGMIPGAMLARGHPVVGSDIIDRPRWRWGGREPFRFYRANFLQASKWPTMPGHRLSIFCNPPYNKPTEGIAERIILHALETMPYHRAAFIVPIEFLAGQGRYVRLFSKHPPSHTAIYCERPSMPPGEQLLALGEDARGGGKADFVALVWTDGGPHRTETLFLRPTNAPPPRSDRRVRRGSQSPSVSA